MSRSFTFSAPPLVDGTAEAVPIIPGSRMPQTMGRELRHLRLQKMLLSSVASMGRIQASASSLDQRVAEHDRLIHENRLPEQIADQIQVAPTKKRRTGRHKRSKLWVVWCSMTQELMFVWTAMIPHRSPWWEEAGEHRPDSMQLFCFLCSPPTPRLLVTWYGTTCPRSSLVVSAPSGGNSRLREMTLEALFR